MWAAVTRQDWTACLAQGREMLRAFGAAISPPLMIMAQCAAASGRPQPALTFDLGRALLAELTAHPQPQADLREQLFLTVRELDAASPAYATRLREELRARGVPPPTR